VNKLTGKMVNESIRARTITVKIKYKNFDVLTRCQTFKNALNDEGIMLETAKNILISSLDKSRKIRLLGVSFSNLVFKNDEIWQQMTLPFFNNTFNVQ